jgi:hypothetical protein
MRELDVRGGAEAELRAKEELGAKEVEEEEQLLDREIVTGPQFKCVKSLPKNK